MHIVILSNHLKILSKNPIKDIGWNTKSTYPREDQKEEQRRKETKIK